VELSTVSTVVINTTNPIFWALPNNICFPTSVEPSQTTDRYRSMREPPRGG
jgi:hypothetical protein